MFVDTAQIRALGAEARAMRGEAGYKMRRWVVERTPGELNRFRRLMIRWEIKPEKDLAPRYRTCAGDTDRAAGRLGLGS